MNKQQQQQKKQPSMEEVEDDTFATESIAYKMVEVNEW
jgi:hypothetical protein